MPDLASEIQRALAPTYGPGGVAGLLRAYHGAEGVPHGAMHAFYRRRALDLPGAAGAYASAPAAGPLNITGDLDLRAWLSLPDWTPSGAPAWVVISRLSGAFQGYELQLAPGGIPSIVWGTGTSYPSLIASAGVPAADGQMVWLRATLDVDAGGGLVAAAFYTSSDGVTWTQLGTTVTTAGAPTTIAVSPQALEVGRRPGGSFPLTGSVRRVEVRDGIGGTVVASPYFARTPRVDDRSFTDAQGNVWSVNGGARIAAQGTDDGLGRLMLDHFAGMP